MVFETNCNSFTEHFDIKLSCCLLQKFLQWIDNLVRKHILRISEMLHVPNLTAIFSQDLAEEVIILIQRSYLLLMPNKCSLLMKVTKNIYQDHQDIKLAPFSQWRLVPKQSPIQIALMDGAGRDNQRTALLYYIVDSPLLKSRSVWELKSRLGLVKLFLTGRVGL